MVPLAVEVALLTRDACREAAAALLDALDHISRGLESEPQYISSKVNFMSREKEIFDDMEGLVLEEARKAYSEKVIDHFLNPRNVGALENPDCFNAMSGICGDTIGIYVVLDNGSITRISFVTNGCGPTIACSSAITCMAMGLNIQDAMKITGQDLIEYLGGMPVEHTHCADLAANTLRSALAKVV